MNGTAERPGEKMIRTQIAGGAAAAAEARGLITDALGETTPSEKLHDLLLLTTELVTNAVKHANVDEDSTLEISIEARRAVRRVAVVDPGGESLPEVRDVDLSIPGGMGLFLVEQLSTRWGSEPTGNGGTRVWFELAA